MMSHHEKSAGKSITFRQVADGMDHFAKGIDALKAKMWNVTEAGSLTYP